LKIVMIFGIPLSWVSSTYSLVWEKIRD